MMTTIFTKTKKKRKHKLLNTMAECIRGFKDPNENDENNEKNNFDENYKKLLSIASFMTHKHSS